MNRSFRRADSHLLLRAARTHPHEGPARWPDLATGTPEELCAWVRHVWQGPVAAAIGDASPSLATTLDRISAGTPPREAKLRRAATSLVGYLLRATGRATPFGLFAGTAPGAFAPHGKLRWGREHRSVARVESGWLARAVAELEAVPALVARIDVVANNRVRRRGDQLLLSDGENRTELTATTPVLRALAAAAAPTPVATVIEHVRAAYPQASHGHALELVTGLLTHGYLLSSLRASSTVTDPLLHLREELTRCRAAAIDPPPAAVARVTEAATGSANAPNPATGEPAVARELRLDCDLAVPDRVGAAVEAGVSALLRLSPYPTGYPAWRQYYEEFVHRYGTATLVPLLEVVDPDMGLGYPPSFPGSLMPPRPEDPPQRDTRLLQLAQEAAATGTQEVVLDDAALARLAVAPLNPHQIPPHVEAAVRVRAPSMAAIEHGDFTIRIRPGQAAGTFTGRFSPADSAMAALYRSLPPATAGATRAQLVFPPRRPEAGNVAHTPRFLDHLICLGEHPPPDGDGVIAVEELAVMADAMRLHLVHTPTNRVVEPQVMHALSLEHQAPPLARFLAQLPRGCLAQLDRMAWGTAADLALLPRLRYGHTVLSPARWRLTAQDLPPRDAAHAQWRAGLERWCTRWRVHPQVELVQGDQVLPLDLQESAHTALLRARVHKTGTVLLTEAEPPQSRDWIQGHAHELAVPLVTTTQPAPSPLGAHLVSTRDRDRGHLPAAPGPHWLYAKIYAHPERHDEILVRHLPALLEAAGQPDWWFLRYRGPQDPDHLRLRLRAADGAHAAMLIAALGSWAQQLRRAGLAPRMSLDTYYPETGRYGQGPALQAAEAVFAADSAAVVARLRNNAGDARATAAAAMAAMAVAFTGSRRVGLQWLIDQPAPAPDQTPPRQLQDETHTLVETGADLLPCALQRALTEYGDLLRTVGGPPTDTVLASLLHMHYIRALGIDRDTERTCRRLARQAALTQTARTREATS